MIQMFPAHIKHCCGNRRSAGRVIGLDPARWSVLRKAKAARAVETGQLTPEEACKLAGMQPDELTLWARVIRSAVLQRMYMAR
jgi:hypothetical protein